MYGFLARYCILTINDGVAHIHPLEFKQVYQSLYSKHVVVDSSLAQDFEAGTSFGPYIIFFAPIC